MGSYRELISIPTIKDRLDYLRRCRVGMPDGWGNYRQFNQVFYHSAQWQSLRDKIIIRDDGCDLAMPGYPVGFRAIIHHINPVTLDQLEREDPALLDPDNLILCGFATHNIIHMGRARETPYSWMANTRSPNDTCPWKG